MHDNSIGMTYLVAPSMLILLAAFIGAILYITTDELMAMVLMIAAGSILPISIYCRDNIRNPRMIYIREDGFVAIYRNGRSEFIPWENINAISYYPGDPMKLGLRKIDKGAYLLNGKTVPHMLKGQLGKEMREAYARKMGKYPPM